jgi:hypothetical protein
VSGTSPSGTHGARESVRPPAQENAELHPRRMHAHYLSESRHMQLGSRIPSKHQFCCSFPRCAARQQTLIFICPRICGNRASGKSMHHISPNTPVRVAAPSRCLVAFLPIDAPGGKLLALVTRHRLHPKTRGDLDPLSWVIFTHMSVSWHGNHFGARLFYLPKMPCPSLRATTNNDKCDVEYLSFTSPTSPG